MLKKCNKMLANVGNLNYNNIKRGTKERKNKMMYEIKLTMVKKDGNEIKKSDIATDVELTTRNGLDAIKYIKEGKTRNTWIEVPNDYQMKKYTERFEVVITEATTGRRIYTITK